MASELTKALRIANSGMKAQTKRLRVISENVANADTLPTNPSEEPYRRKMVTFKNVMDKELGADKVEVKKVIEDKSEFEKKLDPNHPAADKDGYVQVPNVNSLIEMMDMREAQRSYEANLQVLDNTRSMMRQTIQLIGN